MDPEATQCQGMASHRRDRSPWASLPAIIPERPLSLASPQVISGQQLPKVNKNKNSIVDPKVTVEIHGVGRDVASRQTAVVTNNGTCWAWVGPAPWSWCPCC